MAEFRRVHDDFCVSPQISEADLETAAAEGIRTVINNRPDGEEPGQPAAATLRARAEALGLSWIDAPVSAIGPGAVEAMEQALASAEAPVLAFCRSGTRSISTWALAEAAAGRRRRDELVELGAKAGYDLSRLPL
ncbi:MAG TPA: TIGR01244 family sulfur transferase [Caulobacteraceae bacterium]|nr:TIGR01244 family sulfur transferase [Caulobacteraceae bacterium]